MSSTQPYTSAGSGKLLYGELEIVSRYKDLAENPQEYLSQAFSQTEEEETALLQERMANHPSWKNMVESARVEISKNSIGYIVDHEDAMDIEYGNPEKNLSATGLLRSQAKHREYDVFKGLMDKAVRATQNA